MSFTLIPKLYSQENDCYNVQENDIQKIKNHLDLLHENQKSIILTSFSLFSLSVFGLYYVNPELFSTIYQIIPIISIPLHFLPKIGIHIFPKVSVHCFPKRTIYLYENK